jgi:1,4-dihydroxy-2-naphthoyl-CoA hydrolase
MAATDEADWSRAVAEAQPAFARFMGVRITSASRDQVEAELTVSGAFINRNGVLHGGAIMAFADILGGAASVLNLPDGARTTTIESKTNFFRAVSLGETARAVCIPLHRGRTTMVWQTTITGGDGRRAAIITQTQLVMRS